mgnify:CR=1 FL=1
MNRGESQSRTLQTIAPGAQSSTLDGGNHCHNRVAAACVLHAGLDCSHCPVRASGGAPAGVCHGLAGSPMQ